MDAHLHIRNTTVGKDNTHVERGRVQSGDPSSDSG